MIVPPMLENMPKTEFAGCCIDMAVREDPATGQQEVGQQEVGAPKWACQNPECRHRWW
jgi:hypothetical protein